MCLILANPSPRKPQLLALQFPLEVEPLRGQRFLPTSAAHERRGPPCQWSAVPPWLHKLEESSLIPRTCVPTRARLPATKGSGVRGYIGKKQGDSTKGTADNNVRDGLIETAVDQYSQHTTCFPPSSAFQNHEKNPTP